MKLGALFSGGKDSCYAMHLAARQHEIVCLISILSKSSESYMFHTPNINLVKKQAEALGLPILMEETEGQKEEELKDLERALLKAKSEYRIEGIVSGAIASTYQKERIEKICKRLGLECLNPLWGVDQFELLRRLVSERFEVIIVGVFAMGLERFLGRKIDQSFIREIESVYEKLRINPSGEGGEYESFVLNAPMFKHPLEILSSEEVSDRHGGRTLILKLK
ncbi:MAG: diphthine--ammonia ligase [Candidatus Woesearchaeota archaeon]